MVYALYVFVGTKTKTLKIMIKLNFKQCTLRLGAKNADVRLLSVVNYNEKTLRKNG